MNRIAITQQTFQYHLGVTLVLMQAMARELESFPTNRVPLPLQAVVDLCNKSMLRGGEKEPLSLAEICALYDESKKVVYTQNIGGHLDGDVKEPFFVIPANYSSDLEEFI